jgi:hypothetical protein
VNGPSVIVRFFPEYSMRAPFDVGCKPDRSSSTPAFASSSLYLPIVASISSSGMAPPSVTSFPLTNNMNRMVGPPFR